MPVHGTAIFKAMQHSARIDWDYNVPRDASQKYLRNHLNWTFEAE